MPFNIEIKARCQHPEVIEEQLKKKALYKGEDHQVDTYFNVPDGRLKLRQGSIEKALIFYKRPNQLGPKSSEIELYRSENLDDIKKLLSSALGEKVVVDKLRKIYFIENIKIHLDKVKGLGEFVEIEAIGDNEGEKDILHEQCQGLMKDFMIKEEHLLSHSYSDMML